MNKIISKFRHRIGNLILGKTNNAMTLPNQFLKYGLRGEPMLPDWSNVVMSDYDHFSGYGYASIVYRANKVAETARENIRTQASSDKFVHPYLDIIDRSQFSNTKFWKDISIFLDLEGVYYLMAVRGHNGSKYGDIQYFKLLSPYNIQRLLSPNKLDVVGYRENRKGQTRDIPKELIIEMRELNPFSEDEPFSMTDAAKDDKFVMKTSSDYTRHALKHNINAPGILATDIELDDQQFENFMNRVRTRTKGEPIFGNGSGAVKWEDMQSSLKDAALKDINEITREEYFAVAGTSKTILGIEQSGVTRETGKVQKELNMENQILPRIQTILDALNQDYINNYPEEYKTNKAMMIVHNPMAIDYDAELKETEVKTQQFDLYQNLVNRGVDTDTAAKYVKGEVELEMLKIEPVEIELDPNGDNPDDKDKKDKEKKDKDSIQENQMESQGIIQQQQGALQNAIVNVQQQLMTNALLRIQRKIKNSIELRKKDVITEQELNEARKDLSLILRGFYGITMSLMGGKTMRKRISEFGLLGEFKIDSESQKIIKDLSDKAGNSHIKTISDDIYNTARDAAIEGKGLREMEALLRKKYTNEMTKNRAKTISRTETNRAFTTAQFEADRQFIEQNDLGKRAFKQLRTRSDNPCPFCVALSNEPPIPFFDNFRNVGDTMEVGGKTLKIDYMDIKAANLHPNCSCEYQLIIKSE